MLDRPTGSRGRFCFVTKVFAAFTLTLIATLCSSQAQVGGGGPDIIVSFQQNLGGGSSITAQVAPNPANAAPIPPTIIFDPSNTYLPTAPNPVPFTFTATSTAGSNILTGITVPQSTSGITSGFSTITGAGIPAGTLVSSFTTAGVPATIATITLSQNATASGTVTFTSTSQGSQQFLYQAIWNWGDPSTIPGDPSMINVNGIIGQPVPAGGPTTDISQVLASVGHTFVNSLPGGGPAEFITTPDNVNIQPPPQPPSAIYNGVVLTIQQYILTNVTATGNSTINSNILTGFTSTTGIAAGSTVTGPGIPPNTIVGSVTPTTVILIQGPPPPTSPTTPANATSSNTGASYLFGVLTKGTTGNASSAVRVANANYAPTAHLDNIGSPATGAVPYTLVVTPSRSFDQDGFITWAAIDWGDGFTQNLNSFLLTATATAGSNTLTNVASIQGLTPGFTIAGPGIPPGTVVYSANATNITMTAPATASSTGNFTFGFPTGAPAFGAVPPPIPPAFINYMPNTPPIPYMHTYMTPGIYKVTLSIIDNGRISPTLFPNGPVAGPVFPNPPSNDPQGALTAIRQFQTTVTGYGTETKPQTQFEPQLSQDYLLVQVPGNLVTTINAKFSLDLSKAKNDSVQFNFQPNLFADSTANAQVSITLGTGTTAVVLPTFTTDKKGRFNSSTITFFFDVKRKLVKLTIKKSTLRAAFAQSINATTQAIQTNPNIANGATVANGNSDVPVTIVINGTTVVSTIVRFEYTAQAGKKGIGKKGHTLNPAN